MLMRLSGLMVTHVKPDKLTSRQKNNVSVKKLIKTKRELRNQLSRAFQYI